MVAIGFWIFITLFAILFVSPPGSKIGRFVFVVIVALLWLFFFSFTGFIFWFFSSPDPYYWGSLVVLLGLGYIVFFTVYDDVFEGKSLVALFLRSFDPEPPPYT